MVSTTYPTTINFAHPWSQGKLVSHFKLPFVTHFMILALSLRTKHCPVYIFAGVLVLAFQEKMYCGGGGEDGWNGREAFFCYFGPILTGFNLRAV